VRGARSRIRTAAPLLFASPCVRLESWAGQTAHGRDVTAGAEFARCVARPLVAAPRPSAPGVDSVERLSSPGAMDYSSRPLPSTCTRGPCAQPAREAAPVYGRPPTRSSEGLGWSVTGGVTGARLPPKALWIAWSEFRMVLHSSQFGPWSCQIEGASRGQFPRGLAWAAIKVGVRLGLIVQTTADERLRVWRRHCRSGIAPAHLDRAALAGAGQRVGLEHPAEGAVLLGVPAGEHGRARKAEP
jgi:hypothetical protein